MKPHAATTEAVWSELSEDLRAFIRRRVADNHLADDLLQETFVRIHKGLAKLREPDHLTAWVYRIARNVIAEYYRGAGYAPEALVEQLPETVAERDLRRHAARRWLHELIDRLPLTYREAVALAEIEGAAQREVAARLGLSLPAAKSRVLRGRAMLKQMLLACCRFEFDRRGNLLDFEPKPDRTVCRDCPDPNDLD